MTISYEKKDSRSTEDLFFIPKSGFPMSFNLTYTTQRFSAEKDAFAYIADFRRADYFLQFCRECDNYGRADIPTRCALRLKLSASI